MKCVTYNASHSALYIDYNKKYIEETVNANFLGVQIDNRLNWKNHIKQEFPSYVKHIMPLGQ
jgi:hypothetical protein